MITSFEILKSTTTFSLLIKFSTFSKCKNIQWWNFTHEIRVIVAKCYYKICRSYIPKYIKWSYRDINGTFRNILLTPPTCEMALTQKSLTTKPGESSNSLKYLQWPTRLSCNQFKSMQPSSTSTHHPPYFILHPPSSLELPDWREGSVV